MIKARLRTFDLSMIVVSMVMGIGIFRTPQIVAQHAGSSELFFSAWIIGAVVSICGALTFAEIGSRFAVAGGYYAIFSRCYHPMIAFAMNWTLVIMNASSTASVALIGVEYLSSAFAPGGVSPLQTKLSVIGIIAVLYGINMLGLRVGAHAQNILSALKVVLAFVLCSALLLVPTAPTASVVAPIVNTHTPSILYALGTALIPVFFSYGGYQITINLGADVQNASKTIPRAIVLGMACILSLYLLLNMSYVHVLGFDALQHHPLVAAALGSALFGAAGERVTAIIIFISVLGFLNSAFVFNPRICYAMAQEKMLPTVFAKVHPERDTQPFALSIFCLLVIVMYLFLGSFENMLGFVMFNDCLSLGCAATCVFILRRDLSLPITGYKLPTLLIPIIFISCLAAILVSVVLDAPKNALEGCGVIALGACIYALRRRIRV